MLIRVNNHYKQGLHHNQEYLKDALYAYLFRDANDLQDLGKEKLSLTKSGAITYEPTPKGLGSKFGGTTSDYYSSGAIGSQPPQIWAFELLVYIRSSSTQYICGYQETPGSTTADRRIYIDNSGILTAQLYDGANQFATWGAVHIGLNHMIASTDGSSFHLTVNGVSSSTTSVSTGGFSGYGTPEFIIGRGVVPLLPDSGTDHTNLYTIVHDRYMPPAEARIRTNNPFKVFEREIFIPIPAAGGTTSLLPARPRFPVPLLMM